MKLTYTHCALYQFYIDNSYEYHILQTFLPEHETLSYFENDTGNCFPRFVHLDQKNWKIIRVSNVSPAIDYTIARVGDIPDIIDWHFSNDNPVPKQISNNNNMYYFHCAVDQSITDENGKVSVKEIIPYSVRLAKSKTSLRDALIREMPADLDSDDVGIHISEVF